MIPKFSERDLVIFRQGAIRELGLTEQACDPEIRDAFLEALGRDDLQPVSSQLHRSLRMLSSVPRSTPCRCIVQPFESDLDRSDETVVNEFCDSFFKLTPEDRKQRWLELKDALRSTSPYQLRLRQMAPGLSIDLRLLSNDSFAARKIAELILVSFCLPASARPHYRRQVVEDHSVVLELLCDGGEELRERHPEILQLDSRLAHLIGVTGVSATALKNLKRWNNRTASTHGSRTKPRNQEHAQPTLLQKNFLSWLVFVLLLLITFLIFALIEQNSARDTHPGNVDSGARSLQGGGYSGVPFRSKGVDSRHSTLPPTHSPLPESPHLPQTFRNTQNRNPVLPAGNPNQNIISPRNRLNSPAGQSRSASSRFTPPNEPTPGHGGGFSPGGGNFGGGPR